MNDLVDDAKLNKKHQKQNYLQVSLILDKTMNL